jgi:hypothetical protein
MRAQVKQKVNCKIFSLKAHEVVPGGECHLAQHCLWFQRQLTLPRLLWSEASGTS